MKINRTMAYIDGFNLYFGMRQKGWSCYYWLNLWELCQNLCKPNQKLIGVKYFTSKIKTPEDKRKRQNTYLNALKTTKGVELFYGKYDTIFLTCSRCNYKNEYPHEKMSDVQLATQLVNDAAMNQFDVALLICGDRDILPAIEICRNFYSDKRIVAAFPPMRSCDDIRYAVNAYIHVTESELKKSQLPSPIKDNRGRILHCPKEWI